MIIGCTFLHSDLIRPVECIVLCSLSNAWQMPFYDGAASSAAAFTRVVTKFTHIKALLCQEKRDIYPGGQVRLEASHEGMC